MDSFFRVLKRFGRSLVSVVIAGIPAYFGEEPRYLLFAPLIQAIGKALREILKLKSIPF